MFKEVVNHVIIIFGTEVVFFFLSLSNQIKAFGRVTLCPFLLHQLFNSGLSNMKLYERLETESTYPYTHPYSNDSFLPSQGSGSEVGTRGGNIDYPRLGEKKKK